MSQDMFLATVFLRRTRRHVERTQTLMRGNSHFFAMHCGASAAILPDSTERGLLCDGATAALKPLSGGVPPHIWAISTTAPWPAVCASVCVRMIEIDRLGAGAWMRTMSHAASSRLVRDRGPSADSAVKSVRGIVSEIHSRLRPSPRPDVACIVVLGSPKEFVLFFNDESVDTDDRNLSKIPDPFVFIPFSFVAS